MSTATAAADVVRRLLASPPTLAGTRLLCVDGPAGSGKTTLAAAVLDAWPEDRTVAIVHLDDLYPGWTGLDEGVSRAARLLDALAAGRPGRYRRYDWAIGAEDEWRDVERADLLVVEGVGAGALGRAALVTLLVWVEAPRSARVAAGLARDGLLGGRSRPDDELRERWREWGIAEDDHFAQHRTRERADLIIDGQGRSVSP